MTKSEKIIAEVKRYKNEIISDNEGTDYEMGFIAALESIETLISNMLEEHVSEE